MQAIINNLKYLNNENLRGLRLIRSYFMDKDDPISIGHIEDLNNRIKELEELNDSLIGVVH